MNNNKGYTLIEILVVVGVFGLVMGGLVSIIAIVTRSSKKAEDLLSVRQLGDNAIFLIDRKIVQSQSLVETQDCEENMSELTILDTDENIVNFACGENTVLMDGEDIIVIPNGLTLLNCKFSCYNNSSIDFSFTLETGSSGKQEVFKTVSFIRNTQE